MTPQMSGSVPLFILPLVVILSTFAFVLSVILIAKSPKAGACLVGGLVFALPILLYRAALGGAFNTPMGLPFVIIPGTFLFILVIVVLSKAPKAGGVLIAVLVVLGLFGLFFGTRASYRSAVVARGPQVSQETDSGAGSAVVHQEFERVFQDYVSPPSGLAQAPTPPSAPAPIWAAGVDAALEADVYPSSAAAAQALGRRMIERIHTVAGDPNATPRIILFQENNERSLVAGFGRVLEKELPGASCSLEADLRNIRSGEVGVTLRSNDTAPTVYHVEGGVDVYPPVQESLRIVATAFTEDRRSSAEVRLIDKPWVDNFATFASTRPQEAFIIARSLGTCTSESEANQQALDDARARLAEAIGNRPGRRLGPAARPITATDVLQGGFIVDRFAQSFAGSAGKIWRQALLLDVSGPKLAQLSKVKVGEDRQVRESYARMGLSALGVIVLIGVIYFFLNMATMGYYEWSLRIAGVVLAIVAVLSILLVVQ